MLRDGYGYGYGYGSMTAAAQIRDGQLTHPSMKPLMVWLQERFDLESDGNKTNDCCYPGLIVMDEMHVTPAVVPERLPSAKPQSAGGLIAIGARGTWRSHRHAARGKSFHRRLIHYCT